MRPHSQPRPLCRQEPKGLDLEDICMVPPSVAGWRQPRGPGPRRWVPGSEGAAWHFRPLRTWNGERASGEDRRLGPEGEPSSCLPRPVPPPPGLGGIESQAGQEGVWQRSDSGGMETKQMGEDAEGGPLLGAGAAGRGSSAHPAMGPGCRKHSGRWTRAQQAGGQEEGPERRLRTRFPGCLRGCGNRTVPAPGQQNARGRRMKWRQGQREG